MIKLKLQTEKGSVKIPVVIDMWVLTQFMRKYEIKISGIASIIEDFHLLYELFYFGAKKAAKRAGTELPFDFEEFARTLSDSPEEFKKCYDKFNDSMTTMVKSVGGKTEEVEDDENIREDSLEDGVKKLKGGS